MESIISLQNIILDSNAKTQKEAFEEISKLAYKNGYAKSSSEMLNYFIKREEEMSTGLESGFAIPHGKGDQVIKPGIFYVKYKFPIKWKTFDGSDVKNAIFFTIPEDGGQEYLVRLAQVSTFLGDIEKRNELSQLTSKEKILEWFKNCFSKKEESNTSQNSMSDDGKPVILGIVACPAGLAHTYMAKESLEKACKELGYRYHIEAHGALGIDNKIPSDLINRNSILIQATDIGIDLEDRFDEVYIYKTNTKQAIKDPKSIIDLAIKEWNKIGFKTIEKKAQKKNEQKKFESNSSFVLPPGKNKFTRFMKWWGNDTLKHLMTGISYLIPLAIASSVLIAISRLIAASLGYNNLWDLFTTDESIKNGTGWLSFLFSLEYIGTKFGLGTLFVPFITAFICYSMCGKAGLAPGFLVGFVCGFKEMGFIGGMVSGLFTGYVIQFIQRYMRIKGSWSSLTSILFVPVLGTLIGGIVAWWAFGWPFFQLNLALRNGLTSLTSNVNNGGVIIALVFGAMIAFDLGGPVNKAAYAISLSIFGDTTLDGLARYAPNTAVQLSIILPPLALGIASFIGRHYYNEQLKESGKAAFIMGVVGVSEGAIPFAIKNPIRVTILNVLGCIAASTFVVGMNVWSEVQISAFYGWPLTTNGGIYTLGVLIGLVIIVVPNVLIEKIMWHKQNKTKFTILSPIPSFVNFGIWTKNIFRGKKKEKLQYKKTSIELFLEKQVSKNNCNA